MAWFQTGHIPSLSWKRSTSTAYINQLPNELLLIIFHHVCSETPGNDVGLGLSKEVGKDPAPSHSRATDLSCVCVLWGRVIISEPILWTNFRLVYPASSSAVSRVPMHLDHFRQFVDTLQSHVTRSRGLPLTIEVLILSKDPDTSAEAVRLLFHLASRHIRRLRIQAPEAALVKSGTVELPLLEELEILHAKDPSIVLLLTDTPRLHSLHTHFALPRAANTTTLSLDIYLCFGGVNRIYDLFPNLGSLCVREPSGELIRESREVCRAVPPRIWTTVSSLTFHLRWERFSIYYMRCILTSFHFPNLISLHVECSGESLDPNHVEGGLTLPEALIHFILSSSCALEKLVLRRVLLEANSLLRILEHTPYLLELEVDDANRCSPLSSLFIKSLFSPVLVPSLQRLSLTVTTSAKFDDLALVHMVKSRWASSLRFVNIQFPNRRQSPRLFDLYHQLEDFGQQGDITVGWHNKLLQLTPHEYQSVTKYGPTAFVLGLQVILLLELRYLPKFRR